MPMVKCSLVALAVVLGACGDDGNGSFTKGRDLVIDVSPNPVTFGSVATGTHREQIVTIRHEGTSGALSLKSVRFESASSELAITQPVVTSLQPGEGTTMTVLYDPVDTHLDSGTIYIETNVPDQATGTLTVVVPVQTVAQGGFIRAVPDPVSFGDVDVGEDAAHTVTLLNIGSDDVTVEAIDVRNGINGDPFWASFVPTLPATFGPEESISFEVTYAPLGHGGDQGSVDVKFSVQGEPKEMPPILLSGNGVGPTIEAFPNPVDFGWRALDTDHHLPLTITNSGSRDLVISSLEAAPGSSGTVSWTGFPGSGGATIAPNGVLALDVVFHPTSDMVQTTGPIATLVFNSNDLADDGRYEVAVFGRAETPVLTVNPELLDFGFVAQNQTAERKVVLFNAGSAPLRVSAITLTDNPTSEFAIVGDGWGPTAASPTEALLQPSESREVKVSFTNKGADNGTQWGMLRIASNDGTQPAWDVQLKAQRAGAPTCTFTMVPPQLDFGTVARGARKTMRVNLVNTGSGACSFRNWLVNDCATFFGFFEGSCADPHNTVQTNGTSEYYKATSYPLAVQGGLKPGQSYPIDITFTPPETAPITGDEMTDYAGYLAVRIWDDFAGQNVIVPDSATGTFAPNLHAKSGIAQLAVLPADVDFGLTTIGCHSQTIEVTAYNVGSAPLDLTDIKLQGCSPEFRVKSSPGLPSTLPVNGSEKVSVEYIPQDLGDDACGLAFYTNNEATPTIVVPLSGEGTYETEHTDTFTQTTGQNVDVLFVVDNSGSMQEEQSNLATNFSSFIQGAASWQNDYHIGVTTTDLEADNGRLVAAGNNARFVTSATQAQFKDNVQVGTNGSGDEKGLACAQAALSLPHTAGSGDPANLTSCTSDTQCTAPERCWDGYCGGRNRGFIREDATLEVVIVSDEEDYSPADLNFYINFFKSIKGFYNENLFHLHAIVGDVPSGCNSGAGAADAGQRYTAVAQATGGAVVSVCDANFAAGLSSIGDIAFGLRTQFFLGRLPDPTTITVAVAGTSCASGSGANWVYDEPSNSVVFAEEGGCMPTAGQQVVIHYKTLCFL